MTAPIHGQAAQAVILLADDQECDVLLARQALLEAQVFNPLFVVSDGVEAINYLEGAGKFSNRNEYPLPDLMILDIHMPKLDGFEVLRWVRNHPTLGTLRILVQSSSDLPADIHKAYELGANAYMVKSVDFHTYCGLIRNTICFWLEMTRSPTIQRRSEELPARQDKSHGQC
jgi:CheY-like chemotaxis protein